MEEAPVTAATGALGPVIAKLAALLGSEYKLRRRTRRDANFIRSKLKPVHSLLWNIWEREELDEASKALKMDALDLADDMEDAIDDFIISMKGSLTDNRLIQTKLKASPLKDFKKRASDVWERCCSKWEEKKKSAVSSLFSCGKIATEEPTTPGKPRTYPFVRKDASELVGMVKRRDDLIRHLVGKDETTPVELQLKTASILGMAGMGKTTLADQVYEAIGNKFQNRAFVSVIPGGNMREVLTRILQQIAPNSTVPTVGTEAETIEEHLIDIISNFLKNKRYLVIIDDVWNLRELEILMQSLPENNLGSRIVITTRIKDVTRKLCKVSYGRNTLIQEILPEWDSEKGWVYKIGEENIANLMIAMKADLVSDGFECEHPIVQMCGGMPLAVRCMLSAVAQEGEKQAQQGLHAKACDVQDEIEKHVMENGIQNTPGFEALVESLQLGFDDLPHHMLKTCLLYCSIYPGGHRFEREDLVRRWVCEGFVYKEEEANGYFEELLKRGFILNVSWHLAMHPMMRNFLRCKSRQDNFITWSSKITRSDDNCCRIRRLCICKSRDASADPLSELELYHVRSLVVYQGIKSVPFEKFKLVRLLDLCGATDVLGPHWKDICGVVRLRHLLGFNGDGNSETPPEIVRLQRLETFEASGKQFTRLPGFIGDLQQLKTLDMRGYEIKELPREIRALQQLRTLIIGVKFIKELPREIGALQQLRTLKIIYNLDIAELPREIGSLQQLETLDISFSRISKLPKEIWSLPQLKTLNMNNTPITQLPKEIGKLQQLEHLLMSGTKVAKIPREIRLLKDLKSLKMDSHIVALPFEVCRALAFVEFPECIGQVLKKSDQLLSELAGEMLSFQLSGGLVVGAIQMQIPSWIGEHFNDLVVLDIRICKLDEGGLKILREMPQLNNLTLRFQVVPTEPLVISSQGFPVLESLTVDSRVPRVTFQEGAMPKLELLIFEFQFYAGPPNNDPVGINHLRRLHRISFRRNKDWYGGGYSPCIRSMIAIVRKEGQDLPSSKVTLYVPGNIEVLKDVA